MEVSKTPKAFVKIDIPTLVFIHLFGDKSTLSNGDVQYLFPAAFHYFANKRNFSIVIKSNCKEFTGHSFTINYKDETLTITFWFVSRNSHGVLLGSLWNCGCPPLKINFQN